MEQVIFKDMPGRVKGFSTQNEDNSHTICINSRLNFEQAQKVYMHERNHIDNKDFDKKIDVGILEYYAHMV